MRTAGISVDITENIISPANWGSVAVLFPRLISGAEIPRQAESATNRSVRSNEHHDYYPDGEDGVGRTKNKRRARRTSRKFAIG